jgi:hypothetical protein
MARDADSLEPEMQVLFVRPADAVVNLVAYPNSTDPDRLSGPPFVVVEDAAQPFMAL